MKHESKTIKIYVFENQQQEVCGSIWEWVGDNALNYIAMKLMPKLYGTNLFFFSKKFILLLVKAMYIG